MTSGVPTMNVPVVPESGAYQLTGTSGKMPIDIKAGKHFYAFDYSLPEAN
jgi:uncharacterized protein DUF3224